MRRALVLALLTSWILDARPAPAGVLPFTGRLSFEASEDVPVSPISISGAGEATVNGSPAASI